MATITKIEPKGKKGKFEVYIDGEFYRLMSADVIMELGIALGDNINYEELEELSERADEEGALAYSTNYLSSYSSTEKKLRIKLREKGYHKSACDYAVSKLKEYGLLDDYEYARNFAECNVGRMGERRLKSELYQRGISSQIIDEILSELDRAEFEDGARETAVRWAEGRDMTDRKTKERFIRYMQYRGYGWSTVARCLDIIKAEFDEEIEDGDD